MEKLSVFYDKYKIILRPMIGEDIYKALAEAWQIILFDKKIAELKFEFNGITITMEKDKF